jgi:hypothetical protein
MKTITIELKDTDCRYLERKAKRADVSIGEYITDLLQMWVKSSKCIEGFS